MKLNYNTVTNEVSSDSGIFYFIVPSDKNEWRRIVIKTTDEIKAYMFSLLSVDQSEDTLVSLTAEKFPSQTSEKLHAAAKSVILAADKVNKSEENELKSSPLTVSLIMIDAEET